MCNVHVINKSHMPQQLCQNTEGNGLSRFCLHQMNIWYIFGINLHTGQSRRCPIALILASQSRFKIEDFLLSLYSCLDNEIS